VGLFWGLLAGFSYATMNLILRATAIEVDPLVGALIRTIPMTAATWVLLLVERALPDPGARRGQVEQHGQAGILIERAGLTGASPGSAGVRSGR